MTLPALLARTATAGVKLAARTGRLTARPRERVTPELLASLKRHRAALLALLEPARDPDQVSNCPPSWLNLPVLPAERVETRGLDGSGSVYRIRLYGHHYRLLFRPHIKPEQVRADREDGLTWEAPSLAHLQRIAWLESIRAAALGKNS